jgi:hypothetical protein
MGKKKYSVYLYGTNMRQGNSVAIFSVGFYFRRHVQTGSGAHLASYPMCTCGKATGYENDHSPPSNPRAKNAWRCTSAPPFAFMAWCLIKPEIILTFTLS